MNKDSSGPPILAEKILQAMRGSGEDYALIGDINEEYASRTGKQGEKRARAWYWGQVLTGLPAFLKDSLVWSCQMFKNYLVVAWRNIQKHKVFSFINIAGLAVGMAASLLILLWIRDERSYNGFHQKRDRIYLTVSEWVNRRGQFYYQTPVPLAGPLREDYPEIEKVVRFNFRNGVIARRGETVFTDWTGVYVDPEVFEVFTYPFLKGSSESVFRDRNAVVLTETAARKLFGQADPVGQTADIEGSPLEVTGILRDIPKNSDIQADYFRPFSAMKEIVDYQRFIWNWFSCSTYVLLKDGTDPGAVQAKISALLNTNRPWSKEPLDISLFALRDMHLHRLEGGGPILYLYVFGAVAAMIILIACINFMNLSTARSAGRAREVGLRKVVGSRRPQLVRQFFMESTLFALSAAVVAVLLTIAASPLFSRVSGKPLRFDPSDAAGFLGLVGMAIVCGVVAGSYPAFLLSSYQPAEVLKGNLVLRKGMSRRTAGAGFRRGLVIAQFVLSIGLIVCALFVFKQLDFMRNGDMGFNRNNLIRLSIPEKYKLAAETLKTELARSPHISDVAAHSSVNRGGNIDWDGATGDMQYLASNMEFGMVDFDYVKTHQMEIISGRDFSKDFPADLTNAYLLNEEAVTTWNFKDPVGKRFSLVKVPGTVIGVYRNLHFGLKDILMPCVLYLSPHTQWDRFNYVTARLKPERVPEALADIQTAWESVIPDIPVDVHFVDEMIDALYQSEERFSGLIYAFTLLAVGISCLGLFGMASFMAQQKTKEIGIRKVLGASAPHIVLLMTKEIVRWVICANIIAWPAAYFAVRSWLNDYPYRIKIGVEIFLVSALAALAIAVMTVITQAVKSALADPVKSLKYE